MAGPLQQFEIKKHIDLAIGSFDISITNSTVYMIATVVLVAIFMMVGIRRQLIIPGRWQTLVELSFKFIEGLIDDTIGKEGRRYLPAIFTVFMFILVGNLLGMLPYSFTFTSHIIVTFVMAAVVFVLVTILAIVKHGMHFFSFFVPPGAPLYMWPLLIPIEIISYLSRPISLSVRLFANMLAGHTLIKVIAGFIPVLGFFGFAPFALVLGLTGLEILIAFLQAYVFAILTCLYINDALNLH
jgi:F-type H+-transporting ATPase subunit a